MEQTNEALYRKAACEALKYEFIDNIDEFNTLVRALYLALLWGRRVSNETVCSI